jgi:anti-sigma regulatory factor (Ser/Thr protein kinase)
MTSPDPAAGNLTGQPGAPAAGLVDQPFDIDGLYALRATVAAHAADLGASPAEIDHVVILAGELAANAVRHGGGTGRLRLWAEQDRIRLEISDQGPGMRQPTADAERPDPAAAGGRGLWICRQLTPHLKVTTGPHGTTVTAVVPLGGHPTPNAGAGS